MGRKLAIFLSCLGIHIGVACNCDQGGLVNVTPELQVDAESIDFGDVAVGDLRLRGIKLTNKGEVALAINTFQMTTPTGEFLFATPPPMMLDPHQAMDFNLVFEPRDEGEEIGTLTINADDKKGERMIALRGRGVI